jgi:hypothetical protein
MDFNWPLMNKLLPGDLTRFAEAVDLINGNPYYGYKKDLGEASSTRYKNTKEKRMQRCSETC